VDALGNLVRFLLLPGQAHDMKGVAPLIKGVSFDALLADKAFDADWLLQDLDERGATAVIPPKTNRKIQRNYDAEVYKWRHLVENYGELFRKDQRVQRDSHKVRQNRLQLCSLLEPRGSTNSFKMIVNRP
jgi:transposase